MTVPPIPVNSLARHIAPLQQKLTQCAAEVIQSGYYVLGPGVTEFEEAFAGYCGARSCIGVANGTDALELSLKAVGVVRGDKVAVVANAAMYGTTAVLACEAVPVFIDVEASTSNMDPARLDEALAADTGIRAVIVTHLYGRLANMARIAPIARDRGVAIVEDCAQAHGASDGKTRAGSFGDVASFSFYPTKNLGALGDGGAIVTSDPNIEGRARQLRQYGWSGKYNNQLRGGRNSRLDEMQARMLHAMLPMVDGWNARRRDIANRFSREIRHPDIRVPAPAGDEYVGHLYVVHSDNRDALRAHLHGSGIQTDIHYPMPDHRQSCHEGAYDGISLDVTERLARTALTLPCFPELDDNEVDRVIDACNRL